MNGLTSIQYAGKNIGIHFGLPARQWLLAILNDHPEFSENDGPGLNATYAAAILFTGYRNYCAINLQKAEHPYSLFLDFVEKSIDDNDIKKQLDEALEAWSQSVEVKRVLEVAQSVTEGKKKNGKKMKSKGSATVA